MNLRERAWRPLALASLLLATSAALPLGVTPLTTIVPPLGVANCIVRIEARVSATGDAFVGTGTVIDIRPDGVGPGGWFCVLTADHVVSVDNGALGDGFTVSFGDDGSGGPTFDTVMSTINAVSGPANGADRVDLGVLGVRVTDLSVLPTMTLPTLGSVTDGATFFLAGYGNEATLDGPGRRYDVVDTYGRLLGGFNGVDAQVEHSVGAGTFDYRYDSIEASTMFGPPAPDPAIQGEAHVLSGDSGGPSWTFGDGGAWSLVGVHSTSESHFDAGGEWVEEGDHINDVRVASYTSWIGESCDAVVPEPGSMVALIVGFAGILTRVRRPRHS